MVFLYDKEMDMLLTKQVKNSLFGAIVCVICPFVMLFVFGNGTHDSQKTLVTLVFLLFAGLAVFEFFRALRCAKVRGNLIKCKIEVHDDRLSGIVSDNMEMPNSTRYFEILLRDVRTLEVLVPNIGTQKEYATLCINTKNGSTKVAIESAEKAKEVIQNAINNIANV